MKLMFPAGLIVFAAWLCYGVFQWRRSGRLLGRVKAMSPARRQGLATLLILGSAVLLLAGLYGIAALAPGRHDLNVLQWFAVALLGLAFVHAQTMAAAMLISQAQFGVTQEDRPASTSRTPEG